MCGRYVFISSEEEVSERFGAKVPEHVQLPVNYNISPGDMAPVISQEAPERVQLFQFGLTPHWAKKKMYFFNARAEGDENKENDPRYAGALGIGKKPSFRKPIRSQRCLILANAFVEGTTKEKLSKPFLVYLQKPFTLFAFAGIWDTWLNPETAELHHSFAIITTVPNTLLQKIPHHRSPVILQAKDEQKWLSNLSLQEIYTLLKPSPAEEMRAYPIDKAIKNPRVNGAILMNAVGEVL